MMQPIMKATTPTLAPSHAAAPTDAGWARHDWIAIAAHALAHRWPHIPPSQLDDVASELFRDLALQRLAPAEAVARWLAPVVVTAREDVPRGNADVAQRAA